MHPNWHNKFLEKIDAVLSRLRFDNFDNIRTRYTAIALIKWNTDTDFDKGSYSDSEVSGVDDAAVIRLEAVTDLDADFDYETAGDYDLSDSNKLEISSGKAQLKAISGSETDYPFTTAGNYTYDSAKIEVTGGVAKLKGAEAVYAQWHMNESSGTNVPDSSPNGYDGTTVNMEDADWVAAKLNNGLRLDGANEYVNCGNIANFERTQAFSIEAWIKTTATGQDICTRYSGGKGFISYVAAAGTIFFTVRNAAGTNEASRYSQGTVTDGLWHHVVITYDGSSLNTGIKIYLDGSDNTNTGSGANTLSASILTTTNLIIGGRTNSGNFNGDIDEVVIYTKVLSAAEVTARYNSGSGTESEGIVTTNPTIVPNTGFAFTTALSAFTETATKPSGSEIKYHVSPDDGSTWYYWTGAAWAVTDDTYTQANTAADVNTNIGSLAASGTFKFRALLHSDDGTETPELDNIHVTEPVTYSTTDDLYVDTKAASQIDGTDVIEWSTLTDVSDEPANTEIRVLFSVDGRSTWLGWTGSAWDTVVGATTRANATTLANAVANFSDLPLGSNTLDVRIFLYTTDSSVRPYVANLNVIGDKGFKTSGYWESNVYNSNQLSEDWRNVTFSGDLPTGTTIEIVARAANSLTELAAESYGTALSNGDDAGVTGKYIQFKVSFTGTTTARATLDWLAVAYETMDLPESAP